MHIKDAFDYKLLPAELGCSRFTTQCDMYAVDITQRAHQMLGIASHLGHPRGEKGWYHPSLRRLQRAVGVCASAYTLAVIAVERYYAICRPLQSRKWKTKKRALVTISLVWIFSFVCNIGSLFIFDSVPYRTQWTCDTTKGPLTDFFYQLYVTLVLLFIPLCAMVSLYGHVIYALSTVIVSDNPVVQQSVMQELPLCTSTFSEWLYASVGIPSINGSALKEKQQSLSIPSSEKLSVRRRSRLSSINTLFGTPRNSFDSTMLLRSTNQEKILSAKKKVTRMLMTIVAAFAVCWLPSHLWWLLVRASDLAGIPIWHSGLNMALTILTYISSTTNPVTYCFMNKGFRSSIISYFSRRKKAIDLVESAVHM
ncbi:7 transmembrane receptor [Teladorsagia circumcincta]|uniref:7 transmembrane receptor n=1 Tax=Teladorsagia circumcincta TaxID=45464 RepID=A0A2G9V2L3_TELCI|nr:7 transmembrane receptor [Teladorsagia circumcincta]